MDSKNTTTTWPELAAILLVRLGFLWLLVFVSLLLPNDDAAFYAFMGIAFIITIPYSLWLRNRLLSLQFAPLQFIVDLVLVTGLVYFTGGIHSDLTLLYPLVILSAGIVGTPKQAAEITLLGIITYVLMAAMLSNNLIVEYIPPDSVREINSKWMAIVLRGIAFAVFGAVSIYIAKRCNFINKQEQALTSTTATLLGGIPAPALLLDSEGTVLFANEPACSTLQTTSDLLRTRKFTDLCHPSSAPIPKVFGRTAHMIRTDSPPLPVAYETSDLRLQETALHGSKGRKDEQTTVTLLTFNDISHAVNTARQLEKVERITNATRIAGEMAHEIQGPLSVLSASVQLLRHYELKATSADWLPHSPKRRDRTELFNHIEDASARIDTSIKNFVDFAEFSPHDLLSIIKLDSTEENQGYIGHLNTIGRGLRDGQDSHSRRRSDDSQLA